MKSSLKFYLWNSVFEENLKIKNWIISADIKIKLVKCNSTQCWAKNKKLFQNNNISNSLYNLHNVQHTYNNLILL